MHLLVASMKLELVSSVGVTQYTPIKSILSELQNIMASNDGVSMIKKLPAEILERIFRLLPPPKLKVVMQVLL